jgi:hypothetical protein
MVKCVLSTNKYDHYGSPVKVLRNTRPVAMKGRPNTRRFPYPDGTGVTSSNYKKCDGVIRASEREKVAVEVSIRIWVMN